MSESTSMLKKVFSYGTVSTVTVGAIFVLHVLAGRILGVEDYGRFSFALAFVTIWAPLLDPGMYYLLIRELSRDDSAGERYLAHAVSWKLLLGPLFVILVVATAHLIQDSGETLMAVAIIAANQIPLSIKDAFRPTLLARERFGLDALSLAIERFSLLALSSLVLLNGGGLLGLCWAFLIVRTLDLAVIGGMVRRMVPIRIGTDFRFLRAMLRAALPIGGFYITLMIYNYADTVIIAWLRGDQEVGWYSAAYKLYEGPALVPAIIGTVFMPRLSRLFVENRHRFVANLKQGIQWIVVAAGGVTVVGIAIAGWLVRFSYGDTFENSVTALRILLAGILFAFTIQFLQTVMISIDRQRTVFWVAITGLGINVVLNFLVVPTWGYIGASWATVAVEGLACAALSTFAWRAVTAPSFLSADRTPEG